MKIKQRLEALEVQQNPTCIFVWRNDGEGAEAAIHRHFGGPPSSGVAVVTVSWQSIDEDKPAQANPLPPR